MNLSCQIIEDLLPLYEDNVCSAQSRQAVEAHLQDCEACRKLISDTRNLPALDVQPETFASDKAVAKVFRKIRSRWLVSLLVVIFLVPVCMLGWNQVRGTGIHFTNLREIHIGNSFLKELHQGDYEAAYQYLDLTRKENEFLDDTTPEAFQADSLKIFCESAAMLTEAGGIQEYRYIGVDKHETAYHLIYAVQIDNKEHQLSMKVTNKGVASFSCDGSFLDDPLAHLGLWSEYLWQYYEGCYFDPETHQYVYYND